MVFGAIVISLIVIVAALLYIVKVTRPDTSVVDTKKNKKR